MIGKVLILTNNFHYFFLFDISSVTYFINKSIRVRPSVLTRILKLRMQVGWQAVIIKRVFADYTCKLLL